MTWSQAAASAPASAYSLAFGNGGYVVLAGDSSHPSIYVSTNLASWRKVNSLDTALTRVRFLNNLFVAVGKTIATSSDGVTWTNFLIGSQQLMRDVTYAQGKWVAVGGNSGMAVILSLDATAWVLVAYVAGYPLFGITYHDQFIVVGNNNVTGTANAGMIATSEDAIRWPGSTIVPAPMRHISEWNGVLVAASDLWLPSTTTVMSSVDSGRTWQNDQLSGALRFSRSGPFASTRDVIASAGDLVIASTQRGLWRWSRRGLPMETTALAVGAESAVAGASTNILFSTNLTDWKIVYPGPVRDRSALYLRGTFALVLDASPPKLLVSHGGMTWTNVDLGGEEIRACEILNDLFVIRTPSSLFTSADGDKWTRHPSPAPGASWLWHGSGGLAYGNGRYFINDFITSSGGYVSSDLTSWIRAAPIPIGRAAYGDGWFYIFSFDGGYRSKDALTWEKLGPVPDFPGAVRHIAYEDGQFYWLASSIFTSRDGIAWSSFSTPEDLMGFGFQSSQFVGYGSGGAVILSDPIPRLSTVLTNTDPEAFLEALATTPLIRFECDGIVHLANAIHITADRRIEAGVHSVVLSASGSNRLFEIETNATLRLNSITLSGGVAKDEAAVAFNGLGGAILNLGGRLEVNDCQFLTNRAESAAGSRGAGGDIYNARGQLFITNTVFRGSSASSQAASIEASGGSIASEGGSVVMVQGQIAHCAAINQQSPDPASRALGGALISRNGSLSLAGVSFVGNTVAAGEGRGGAIAAFGSLQLERCSFQSNGAGGLNIEGAAIYNGGQLTATQCYFRDHFGLRSSGLPGPQRSGAIFSSNICSFSACTFENNWASGDTGLGGAVYALGTLGCTNCTFYKNQAAGPRNSAGAGIFLEQGAGGMEFCTFAENGELSAQPGPIGTAVACGTGAQATLRANIFSSKAASPSVSGNVTDAGNNLAADEPAALSSATSLTRAEAKLGAFGLFGGATPVFALLPDSPAIDRGPANNYPLFDQRGERRPFGSRSDIGAFESLEKRGPAVILQADQELLQAALNLGGEIILDYPGALLVTKTLEVSTETSIASRNSRAVLDGAASSRIFVVHTNAFLSLEGLQLQNGRASPVISANPDVQPIPSRGSAILNEGGVLRIQNCVFFNNSSVSTNVRTPFGGFYAIGAIGGDIANLGGKLSVEDSSFSNSLVRSSDFTAFPQPTAGGSIYSENGDVRILRSTFARCKAVPGTQTTLGVTGATNGSSQGGAICLQSGTMEINRCSFTENSTYTMGGGTASAGGEGMGAAIYNGGILTAIGCEFKRNFAPSILLKGAAIYNQGALKATNCYFTEHRIVRPAFKNTSGIQLGGAVYCATTASFSGCTFANNEAIGSGPFFGIGTIPAQPAYGGAVYAEADLSFVNCTFFNNKATGGSGGATNIGSGTAYGGAVYQAKGTAAFDFCTFADNSAIGGTSGSTNAPAYGTAVAGVSGIGSSIIASKTTGTTAPPFFGTVLDLGFNLATESPAELTAASSILRADPKLGPFGFYGGYAPTLPLEAISPAVDRGNPQAKVKVDGRGAPRLEGAAPDIGALERSENKFLLLPAASGLTVVFTSTNAASAIVESSPNLKLWNRFTLTNAPGSSLLSVTFPPTNQTLYFRARTN